VRWTIVIYGVAMDNILLKNSRVDYFYSQTHHHISKSDISKSDIRKSANHHIITSSHQHFNPQTKKTLHSSFNCFTFAPL